LGCIHIGVMLVRPNSMFGLKFPDEWAVPVGPTASWGQF
jgi:hypothetical protein